MSRDAWLQTGSVAQSPQARAGEGARTPQPAQQWEEDPTGTPTSANKVLHGRQLFSQQTKKECDWQQGAGASNTAANKFCDEIITSCHTFVSSCA